MNKAKALFMHLTFYFNNNNNNREISNNDLEKLENILKHQSRKVERMTGLNV